MKLALYSVTYMGLWYRGEALSAQRVLARAKRFGYDGLEIGGKRPHGNPLDMTTARCRELQARAENEGIAIPVVAANNDFSSPIVEHRECQLLYLRELLRMASDLGAGIVRVLLGWSGVTIEDGLGTYKLARSIWQQTHEGLPDEQVWAWCRDALAETARYAGDFGVSLALQNHAPVIKDHQDVLRMVREVNSPHLKVCLDAPLLTEKDDAYARQAALDAGCLQVHTHFGGEFKRDADGRAVLDKGQPNLPAFVAGLKQIGYEGYLSYELCHPLPVVEGQRVGIEYVDENVKLAAEYARAILAQA